MVVWPVTDDRPVFIFGTLCYEPLLKQVCGAAPGLAATADGWRACRAETAPVAVLDRADAMAVTGQLLHGRGARAAADYARGRGLAPVVLTVAAGGQTQEAVAFGAGLRPGAPWDGAAWAEAWGALTLAAVTEALESDAAPEILAHRWPMMLARAEARRRAARAPAPLTPSGLTVRDVKMKACRTAYRGFFTLEEMELSHRRFDGSQSPVVSRAILHASDAVIVLPYDPARDRVLLIEQLRIGPLGRGDPHPWSLEPVAGRIEAGDSAEATARRETREEAGIDLRALEPVADCYPSPGTISESHSLFLGLCDLPDGSAGAGGLASEHEDIQGHLLAADAFIAMADQGQLANGPLLILALWLARHRERLRGRA